MAKLNLSRFQSDFTPAAIAICISTMALFCFEPYGHSAPPSSKTSFQNALEQGDAFYEAGMLSKAIPAYQSLITSLTAGRQENDPEENQEKSRLLMQARFNLAQAYLAEGENEGAATLLKENINTEEIPSSLHEIIRRRSLFHLAIIEKNQKRYADAIRSLNDYLSLPPPLEEAGEAKLELGIAAYMMGDYRTARASFESLAPENNNIHLRTLADLYLARILSVEGDPKSAAAALDSLASSLKNDNPLLYEVNHLRGDTAFGLCDYNKAIHYYKSSLPENHPENSPWFSGTQYRLGLSYMKLAEERTKTPEAISVCYDMAEDSLRKMLQSAPNEEGHLALAQCYLARVGRLKQDKYYSKAEELLSKDELFTSPDGKTLALLLRAEAAPTYAIRDKYYRQLTKNGHSGNTLYVKGWYMRALNDFDYGTVLIKKGDLKEGRRMMADAASAFRATFDLMQDSRNAQAGETLKLEAVASGYSESAEGFKHAVAVLEELMQQQQTAWRLMEMPNEVLYLHGYYNGRLALATKDEQYLNRAAESLLAAASMQGDHYADLALRQLGGIYYEMEAFDDAEKTYLRHADAFPGSPFATESLVWAARCGELLHRDPSLVKERRRRALDGNHEHSPFAAEAYFDFYTYQEYLQGDRAAIRHLQAFADKYPDSPYLIEAHYLIGLDNKRDRKNNEGKWIRKKSPTDAIDAFQKAEILFDDLADKHLIPKEKLAYYAAMRYRATFERAMANLSIASEAHAAKKRIYLDYAEEVFKGLLADLNTRKSPAIQLLLQSDPHLTLREECTFWLAQTSIKAGKDGEAEQILNGMVDAYNKNGISQGYYLSRTLAEQGKIATRREDYRTALKLFRSAEEASRGNILSTDQKLDLLIQQSLCCRSLGQFDDAILILSKVINDDAISSLRVKAMFLRAETYEIQGRPELAKKQLESMVKKGGAWARKAQEKLDKDYLNHVN